jgi:hypothetical protein
MPGRQGLRTLCDLLEVLEKTIHKETADLERMEV